METRSHSRQREPPPEEDSAPFEGASHGEAPGDEHEPGDLPPPDLDTDTEEDGANAPPRQPARGENPERDVDVEEEAPSGQDESSED